MNIPRIYVLELDEISGSVSYLIDKYKMEKEYIVCKDLIITKVQTTLTDYLTSKAFIVICYSILEKTLLDTCNHISNGTYNNGDKIDRFIDFICNNIRIERSKIKDYNKIKFWRNIRNCIVHNSGRYNHYLYCHKKQFDLFEIEYSKSGYLLLELRHVLIVCDTIRSFLDGLLDEIINNRGWEK